MYPGGEPTSRDTACFSMYSDMSMRTIASSSPKRNSASVRASSVLPVGRGQDRAGRPLRVLQAGARAPDRLGDDLDRLVLTDDALVQLVLHPHQLRGLGLGE